MTGISRIGIKGNPGIGRSGSRYWTPQNLVVEDAEPTKVVMTGSVANTNLIANDFTIEGFTVSSLARDATNKILTLTLSTAVAYGQSLTVVYKAKSYPVTLNYSSSFVTTWNTELAGSETKTIVIPTYSNGYNCLVNWGDGLTDTYVGGTLNTAGNITHVYSTTGIKTVSISGTFPQIRFNHPAVTSDRLKLLTIANWGTGVWRQMDYAFSGCNNMTGTYTDVPNTTQVVNFSFMFGYCYVFNSPVNFDTSNGVRMDAMFARCFVFNQSISAFNTSKVITMADMFSQNYVFNQSVSTLDTHLVSDMRTMFNACYAFNQPVSTFNTSACKYMSQMFYGCAVFNQSISSWDTTLVQWVDLMFQGSGIKQSFASFNIAAMTAFANFATGIDINQTGTTTNYDATLVAWEAQVPQPNIVVNFGSSKYSAGGAAAEARAALIADHGWTITDGGSVGLPSGVIAEYEMNGNVRDLSGNAYHLTNTGAVTLTTDRLGAANKAYNGFNTTKYLGRDAFTQAQLGAAGTILVWFKADSYGNIYPLISYTAAALSPGWAICYISATNSLRFWFVGWTGKYVDVPITDTVNWHCLIVSYVFTGGTFYFKGSIDDGQVYTSTATALGIDYTGCEFRIGFFYGRTEYWHGKIDQVILWPRELTAAEKTAAYNYYV